MILDHIRHAALYQALPGVGAALAWLSELSEEDIPDHRLELDGMRLFVTPVSFTSRPACDCRFEAHRRYADIHYVISGTELIGVAPVGECAPVGEFSEADDFGLFAPGGRESWVVVRPGELVVTPPCDAHKPGCCPCGTEPAPLKKICVKVLVD